MKNTNLLNITSLIARYNELTKTIHWFSFLMKESNFNQQYYYLSAVTHERNQRKIITTKIEFYARQIPFN